MIRITAKTVNNLGSQKRHHTVKNFMVLSLSWGWLFKSKHVALALTHAFYYKLCWRKYILIKWIYKINFTCADFRYVRTPDAFRVTQVHSSGAERRTCIERNGTHACLFFPWLNSLSSATVSYYRGFTITLRYTPHSVGLLWTGD